MIRRPPRSTQSRSSAASDVYKRQLPVLLEVPRDLEQLDQSVGELHTLVDGLRRRRLEARTDLEVPRVDVLAVPEMVSGVTCSGVENVRDRARAGRRHDSSTVLLDLCEDPLGGLPEVVLLTERRARQSLPAGNLVRARRPHEVVPRSVDVHRVLDVVEGLGNPREV